MVTKTVQRGFSLIEVMIVAVIIGILAAIAFPAYTDQMAKTRRADAKIALTQLANRMEQYYIDQTPPTYVGAAVGAGGIYPSEAPVDGSNKYYDLSIVAANGTSFTLQAAPKNGQAGDGSLRLLSDGTRQYDANHNGSFDAGENVWP